MKKKSLVCLAAMLMCVLTVPGFVFADGDNNEVIDSGTTCSKHFMGLPAWYDGLPKDSASTDEKCIINPPEKDDDGAKLQRYIWTIVLNVASMIIGVAGYLAIAMIIFGGFQYMLAQGNAAKASSAMKTIRNSLIGAIMCSTASILSGAIRGIITNAGKAGRGSGFATRLFNTAMVWSGIICVIMVVIGGIYYSTSNGDANKVTKGKNTITYAIIGLIITLSAAAIVNTVLGGLG